MEKSQGIPTLRLLVLIFLGLITLLLLPAARPGQPSDLLMPSLALAAWLAVTSLWRGEHRPLWEARRLRLTDPAWMLLAGLGLFAIGWLTAQFFPAPAIPTESPWPGWSVLTLVWVALLALREELLFRWLILEGGLSLGLPRPALLLTQAALFAFVHAAAGPAAVVQAAAAGLWLGWVYLKNRHWLTVFGAHALFNSILLLWK